MDKKAEIQVMPGGPDGKGRFFICPQPMVSGMFDVVAAGGFEDRYPGRSRLADAIEEMSEVTAVKIDGREVLVLVHDKECWDSVEPRVCGMLRHVCNILEEEKSLESEDWRLQSAYALPTQEDEQSQDRVPLSDTMMTVPLQDGAQQVVDAERCTEQVSQRIASRQKRLPLPGPKGVNPASYDMHFSRHGESEQNVVVDVQPDQYVKTGTVAEAMVRWYKRTKAEHRAKTRPNLVDPAPITAEKAESIAAEVAISNSIFGLKDTRDPCEVWFAEQHRVVPLDSRIELPQPALKEPWPAESVDQTLSIPKLPDPEPAQELHFGRSSIVWS